MIYLPLSHPCPVNNLNKVIDLPISLRWSPFFDCLCPLSGMNRDCLSRKCSAIVKSKRFVFPFKKSISFPFVETHSHCGGLSENFPLQLMYLNSWSPVGGAVWGGPRGSSAFLEELHYHWQLTLRCHSLIPPPVLSLSSLLWLKL